MLNNVAHAVNRADRQRVLRHPNSLDCVLLIKQVDRNDEGGAFDGAPTLGGAGMLSSEDEVNYSWVPACDARINFAQGFAAPLGNTSDDGRRLNYEDQVLEASIEPLAKPDEEGYVQPVKDMLVAVLVGGGVIVNYQVVDVTGEINIPPYTRKYLLNPRPDEVDTAALEP
ncbi:hypothetical protein [Pseudomonas sp. PNPG3]|uniref:hypothetical protein n=1 Tax=Pseudomonas sp. PNPG3 TaxID=2919497 RepID=UPI001FFD3CF0|nr:hypothetical protein [Pseudomonas sp. PNPG3]MCK2122098.1 hypothetical protein [Pseudomonas sp. PNPG3]